jgi:murein DD-endopeptidase MepM/ murein hydrolase activator NlpD
MSCEAIWDDLQYFPVPEPSNQTDMEVTFEDSWMFERNYGGKRGHEGTDIMASTNERGVYPIVSMTDGTVLHKGWLEQGGYRLGITAPGGAYFYYAHLDSYADLEEGDTVKAGDLLGFMGDTGYSDVEGTTGNFPVHLHVGIYLVLEDKEISVNPYYPLRYLESRKIKCAY